MAAEFTQPIDAHALCTCAHLFMAHDERGCTEMSARFDGPCGCRKWSCPHARSTPIDEHNARCNNCGIVMRTSPMTDAELDALIGEERPF